MAHMKETFSVVLQMADNSGVVTNCVKIRLDFTKAQKIPSVPEERGRLWFLNEGS